MAQGKSAFSPHLQKCEVPAKLAAHWRMWWWWFRTLLVRHPSGYNCQALFTNWPSQAHIPGSKLIITWRVSPIPCYFFLIWVEVCSYQTEQKTLGSDGHSYVPFIYHGPLCAIFPTMHDQSGIQKKYNSSTEVLKCVLLVPVSHFHGHALNLPRSGTRGPSKIAGVTVGGRKPLKLAPLSLRSLSKLLQATQLKYNRSTGQAAEA